jgi:hypothetical protein
MDVECTSCLNHDITTSLGLAHTPIFVKSTSTCYTGHRPNSVGVDSCAHPQQHIKVVKHFVYIWYGCGMHFTGVWSLNHDLTTSQRLSHALNFSKIPPHPYRWNSVRVPPYAHPQHIKVLNHFVYIWYGCGVHFMGVWSLNHDITTSLGLSHTQIFLKIPPTSTGVPV